MDVAAFHITMLGIREENGFVPESKRLLWMDERLTDSLRCSWSESIGERGKDEVEEEESHGVRKRHQISVMSLRAPALSGSAVWPQDGQGASLPPSLLFFLLPLPSLKDRCTNVRWLRLPKGQTINEKN